MLFISLGLVSFRVLRAESQHFYPYGYRWIRVVSKERSHKWVEHDRPGELSPEYIGLLLAVNGVSTTCAVVTFRASSCITSVQLGQVIDRTG